MSLPAAAPRVIVAVSGELRPRLRAVLHRCELRFVQTGSELVRALDEARCAMMIVEVHFDEAAAVAALSYVLSRGENFPVVCVRDVPLRRLRHAVLDALRIALGGIGAHEFIDLVEYPDDESGNARVRALLEPLLPACA